MPPFEDNTKKPTSSNINTFWGVERAGFCMRETAVIFLQLLNVVRREQWEYKLSANQEGYSSFVREFNDAKVYEYYWPIILETLYYDYQCYVGV